MVTRVLFMASCLTLVVASLLSGQPPKLRSTLKGHTDVVCVVAFSPDGKCLASAGQDRTVRLWDISTGENYATLRHTATVEAVAISPDGRTLASGGIDEKVQVWDMRTGKNTSTFDASSWTKSLAFSPDGKILAAGACDNAIRLWDVASGKKIADLKRDEPAIIHSVAFSLDGKLLAASMGNGGENTEASAGIRLWDVGAGKERAFLKGHTDTVLSVAFSPDRKTLASGGLDNTLRLWNIATGENTATLKAVLSPSNGRAAFGAALSASSVAFSPDGKTLASGNGDGNVVLWDVAARKRIAVLGGHVGLVNVAFSPDGKILAVGNYDNTIMLWDLP